MAASSVDRAYSNVQTVYKKENCFLNADLEVVEDQSQAAKLSEVVAYIQKQRWDVSQSDTYKTVNNIRAMLGLIYRGDSQSCYLPMLLFRSIQVFNQAKELSSYATELQLKLSALHAARFIYKKMYEEVCHGMRVIKIEAEVIDELGVILDGIQDGKMRTLLPFSWIKNTYAMQLYILYAREGACLSQESYEALDKELYNPDSDTRKVAYQLLSIHDYNQMIGESNERSVIFYEKVEYPLSLSMHIDGPNEEIIRDTLKKHFPALIEYAEHLNKYRSFLAQNQKAGKVLTRLDPDEYQMRLKKLGALKENLEIAEASYQFLERELFRVKKQLNVSAKTYSRSVIIENFQTDQEKLAGDMRTIPSFKEYLKILPDQIDPTIPFEARKLVDLVYQHIEKAWKQHQISDKTNWKLEIGLVGGFEEPLVYDTRVTRWFKGGWEKVVKEDPKYSNKPNLVKEKVAFFHDFPAVIDHFVGTNYSFFEERVQRGKQSLLYAVPAEIHRRGRVYKGFFQYEIIDGVCRHRCFSERTDYFAQAILMNEIWTEADFPTPQEAKEISQSNTKRVEMEQRAIYVEPVLGTVELRDLEEEPDTRIYLYKVKK